jgi:stress-induced morphogen
MDLIQEMRARILAAHPAAHVEFNDLTGGGDHWQATIVAPTFAGLTPIARQRSVYAALGDLMQGPIHAFTMRTVTPAEAEQES